MPIFRMAGMAATAACVALAMLAGTHFTSTHKYIGGGNSDAAEFVNIKQATPTPASTETIVGFTLNDAAYDEQGDTEAATTSQIGEASSTDDLRDNNDTMDLSLVTPTMEAVMASPSAVIGEADHTEVSEVPVPNVTPTPIPNMDLLFLEDLLLVAEAAETDLFTDHPAYEVTVTDEDGNSHSLKIWIDGKRIYCKDEAAGTAWYTFGKPDQLIALLGEPAPTPAVTPETNTAIGDSTVVTN